MTETFSDRSTRKIGIEQLAPLTYTHIAQMTQVTHRKRQYRFAMPHQSRPATTTAATVGDLIQGFEYVHIQLQIDIIILSQLLIAIE